MGDAEQAQRPITYGDLFNAQGDLAFMPVTKEDASLMQSAEALAMGQTKKRGAASMMQAAAAKNLLSGAISPNTHTIVPEKGVTVVETTVPGKVEVREFVAGKAVVKETVPIPTDAATAGRDAITIGEALEVAAVGSCDKPVEDSDARAIQSAVARATGVSVPVKGDIAAKAQAAAQLNTRYDDSVKMTIGDVLMDASSHLTTDKVVTHEDARKAREVELRGAKNGDNGEPGVISGALEAAANMNNVASILAAMSHPKASNV